MASTNVNIRLPDELLAWVDGQAERRGGATRTDVIKSALTQLQGLVKLAEGDHSLHVREALEYLRVLELDGRRLARAALTPEEQALIADVLNGCLSTPATFPLLWAEVDDAIRLDGMDRKWNVDGAALVEKLRALPAPAAYALTRAGWRFWGTVGAGEQRDPHRLLEGTP